VTRSRGPRRCAPGTRDRRDTRAAAWRRRHS
jgi:hypothetical protein